MKINVPSKLGWLEIEGSKKNIEKILKSDIMKKERGVKSRQGRKGKGRIIELKEFTCPNCGVIIQQTNDWGKTIKVIATGKVNLNY